MKIGNIIIEDRPLFLAPMEDVTDIGFRKLCKRFGASMVYTEFVSAEALVRSIKSTVNKLTIADEERPVGIQIYGRDVPQMVEAAKIVESEAHPDVIDLNFGCPVKKVAGKGAGAGMLQNIPLLLDITREVVKAVNTPVTVKTRLGWNKEQLIITQLAEQLQDCGIQALTIHGRTRSQMYTGEADWTLIGEVKNNPRITIPTLDINYKIDILKEQLEINLKHIAEEHGPDDPRNELRAILHTRRHLAASPIFKGIPDFRKTRIALLRAETQEELIGILEDIREMLDNGNNIGFGT